MMNRWLNMIALIACSSVGGFAQSSLHVSAHRSALFSLTFENVSSEDQRVLIEALVRVRDSVPVTIRFEELVFPTGTTSVNSGQLAIAETTPNVPWINESGLDVASIEVVVSDALTRNLLGREVIQHSRSGKRNVDDTSPFAIHGTISAEGMYGTPYLVAGEDDFNYNVTFDPQLTLFGLPFNGQTSFSSLGHQQDQLKFSFDVDAFKSKLKERLRKEIEKEADRVGKVTPEDITRLRTLEAMLSDSAVLEHLEQAALLDSLGTLANEQALNALEDSISILRSQLFSKTDSLTSDQRDNIERSIETLQKTLTELQKLRTKATQLQRHNANLAIIQQLQKERDQIREKVNSLAGWNDLQDVDLYDANLLRSNLSAHKLLTPLEEKLTFVDRFQLGQFYTAAHPFMLWGSRVTGIDASVTTGTGAVVEVTAGNSTNTTWYDLDTTREIRQHLVALGLGKRTSPNQETIVRFLWSPEVTTRSGLKFSNNQVLGLSTKANALKNAVNVTADFAYSLLSNDLDAVFNNEPKLDSTSSISNLSGSDIDDFAIQIRARGSFLKNKLKMKVRANQVGADFYSAGAPYLRNDWSRYEASADYSMLRWLSVGVFSKHETYEMSWNGRAVYRHSGLKLKLNPGRATFIHLEYSPTVQQVGTSHQNIALINGTAFTRYKIAGLNCYSMMNAFNSGGYTQPQHIDSTQYLTSRLFTEHGFTTSEGLALSANAMYASTLWNGIVQNVRSVGVSSGFMKPKWRINFLADYQTVAKDSDISFALDGVISLSKFFEFVCRIQKHSYIAVASLSHTGEDVSVATGLRVTW